MMGAVVTGRPVESAWLLHSERIGSIVDNPMFIHTWKIWFVSRQFSGESGNIKRAGW